MTALLEYLDLHACLHVAVAAGDYPSSNLMSYSGGTPTSLSPFAAIQKGILSCEFKIYLTARTTPLQDYMYGEASVMFRA